MSLSKELHGECVAPKRAENFPSHKLTVRLLEPPNRVPATPVEELAVAALRREPTSFMTLVEQVAHGVYLNEVRAGAWVLDIGLLGSRLFARDVARELQAADGVLWEIRQQKEPVQ